MNKIDFLKYTSFPMDSNTLDFMQEMIQTVAKLSAICSETAIIAGCEEYGNGTVNAGIVIIEGDRITMFMQSAMLYLGLEVAKTMNGLSLNVWIIFRL